MADPNVAFADLHHQEMSLTREIRAGIARVIERGWFILGSEGKSFEREFASAVGTSHAVGVACGTDALTLGLTAVGVSPGERLSCFLPATARRAPRLLLALV